VRCANCGHVWHHNRTAPTPPTPVAIEFGPVPDGPLPRARRGGTATAVAAVLALILAGAFLGGIVYHDRVVALWPPAAGLYALVGLPGPPPGEGLEIRKVVPSRTADGLVINGEIANIIKSPCNVPRLRIVLRDAHGKELAAKIVDPPKKRLAPGETEHFATPFDHPSDAATGVVVTFAPA